MENKKLTSIFRNKNFSLVFFGALVTNIGSLFYSFTVSFYILEITDNNAALQGTYLAVCSIVYLVTSLFGGVMSDNYHKARIMFICDYMKGVLILLATLGLFLMQENVNIALGILFVMGICGNIIGGIFNPASNSLLPDIVDKGQLQKAQSYFSAMNSIQGIVTPEMWLSIFSICGGVASTVTAIVISKRKQKDKFGKSMKIWLTIFSGVIILIAVSYLIFVQKGISLNAFIISFCIFSIFSAMICCQINIPAHTAVLLTVDKDNLGKVMSLIGVAAQGFIPLSSLISGIILNRYGIAWLFAFCAVGFVLTDAIVVSSRYVNEI